MEAVTKDIVKNLMYPFTPRMSVNLASMPPRLHYVLHPPQDATIVPQQRYIFSMVDMHDIQPAHLIMSAAGVWHHFNDWKLDRKGRARKNIILFDLCLTYSRDTTRM